LGHLTRRFSCLSPLTPLPAGGLERAFEDDDDDEEDEILLSPTRKPKEKSELLLGSSDFDRDISGQGSGASLQFNTPDGKIR
jgi:hypothetical protein